MKIKLLRGVIVSGHPGVRPGDVFEVTDGEASGLISSGNAMRYEEIRNPVIVETREPEIESRDPEIKTEKRAKKSSPRNPAT